MGCECLMAKWNIGSKNGMWKGGRTLASNGYWLLRVGRDHHLSDCRGYAYEHRVVAEEKMGRKLLAGEIVHHVNHDRSDNQPENIEVVRSVAHHLVKHRSASSQGLRGPDEANPMVACACGCDSQFLRYDSCNRPRRFVSGHNTRTR